MSETTVGEFNCPVCDQPLDVSAPKCFRCTTELTSWWPLEEALRTRPAASVSVAETKNQRARSRYLRWVVLLLAAGLLGFAGGSMWQREPDRSAADDAVTSIEPRSPAPREARTPPTSEPVSAAPRFVRYTVQPGDSLWRIAASLTRDGENWRRLWPEYEGLETKLQSGTNLEIPITELQEALQDSAEGDR